MRFTRPTAALAALALAAACAEAPAPTAAGPSLITYGTPTGSDWGSVGALLFDFDRNGKYNGDDQLCTGSLISATVFLTAAHCVEFLPADAQLHVTFAPDLYKKGIKTIAATGFAYDPGYWHDNGDPHDIAVVLLPKGATTGMEIYQLPPAGYLDQLSAQGALGRQLFVNVGYGTGNSSTGEPRFPYDGLRKTSKSEYMGLRQYWLGLLMNANATGEGGDCYGDSGGPKFIDGNPHMVVATVITGDIPCRATSWNYRLDTDSARDFLAPYVTLP
ncbi:MAG TPA: trypsin-like serine protease [Gemmatimonadaceae bacterium]|nr:trypsin-like serine protease [Gemmatimonadaceae bacterium]